MEHADYPLKLIFHKCVILFVITRYLPSKMNVNPSKINAKLNTELNIIFVTTKPSAAEPKQIRLLLNLPPSSLKTTVSNNRDFANFITIKLVVSN